MDADVDDALDTDEPRRLLARAPAHASDQGVAPGEPAYLLTRLLGHGRQLGPRDDRRERPVHVEQHGRAAGLGAQPRQPILHTAQNTAVRFLVIGLVAGLFSALFGVGGGIVVVPLLILLAHYAERPAMATSLAAVGLIALVGATTYAFHGEVKPGAAAVVGLPAALGAVFGTGLQQRLQGRTLSLGVRRAPGRHRDLAARLMWALALAALLGLAAGVLSGLFGVGGGILFVPTLTLVLGLTQLHAEATSLLAILPTAAAGVWRQGSYGNVRWRTALVLGLGAIAGVEAGVQIAESLPEHALRRLFAVLMLGVAAQLAWRAWRKPPYAS